MNLDELRTVQSKERRKDSLQHLRDSFYEDVADYIAGLKTERKEVAAQADDPFSSPEISRLTDEIETAEEVVEAVYERRVGKVVKLASFAAASMPVEEDGMTVEEQELFTDLVGRIEQNKTAVLDVLSSTSSSSAGGSGSTSSASPSMDGDAESTDAPSTPETSTEPTESAPSPTGADGPDNTAVDPVAETTVDGDGGGLLTDAMGSDPDATSESETADTPAAGESPESDSTGGHTAVPPDSAPPEELGDLPDTAGETEAASDVPDDRPVDERGNDDGETTPAPVDDIDRTTVRITRDVGAIFGVDEREYDLAKEDVVTLPHANAQPLLDREAAERLD